MEAIKLKPEIETQKKEDDYFVIDNDQKANWALRKIRHLKKKKNKMRSLLKQKLQLFKKK
jgi:hypothetical protein